MPPNWDFKLKHPLPGGGGGGISPTQALWMKSGRSDFLNEEWGANTKRREAGHWEGKSRRWLERKPQGRVDA